MLRAELGDPGRDGRRTARGDPRQVPAMRLPYATPTAQKLLLGTAAISPAHRVPWWLPFSSSGWGMGSGSLELRS